MIEITVILSLVSFFAGLIDSIAGGGGLLLLPALLLAGLPPQTALGTNKFAASMGTGTALFNFIRGKKVVWKIAVYGIFFALLGGVAGSKAVLALDNRVVAKIIVVLLPLAAIATLYPRKNAVAEKVNLTRLALWVKVPLICFLFGAYDGFFGPGTGSFFIIAFYLFLNLGLVESSATAKVFNLLSNLGALVMFIIGGKVIYLIAVPLALANIAGNYLGSHLTLKKEAQLVKVFLMVSLTILFVTLIWKYFW